MRQLIYLFIAFTISFLWSCNPIHKQSVEDERWLKIIENYESHEINKFFNDYPNSKHFPSLIEFVKHIEFDEDLNPPPPCCGNFIGIRMITKDSVWVDEEIYHIDEVGNKILEILRGNYSRTDFVDHLGNGRNFSNSVFAISIIDSIPMNQEILVKVKAATNQYKNGLIKLWYPNGYPLELVDSKFEKKMNSNLFFSWRKPPPIPPKPNY